MPRTLCLLAALLAFGACSTLDRLAVGRSDRLSGAPFYVDYARTGPAPGPVLVLPAAIDPLAAEFFTSLGRGAALTPLLTAIDADLAASPCCVFAGPTTLSGGAPQLYVGSLDGEYAPAGTGIERMPHEEYAPMIAHLQKPRPEWRQAVAELAAQHGASRVVLVQVSFTQFPKADRGMFGKKVVLGTNHEQPVRVLSAVDKPVEVIALTGVVVDAGGTVLRAGAEGILGEDAPFWVQVLEAGRDIDTAAIARVVNETRRDELPGAPLAREEALRRLLEQLLASR